MKRIGWPVLLFVGAIFHLTLVGNAQELQNEADAIRKTIDSYVAAFNERDAKVLAEHWADSGVYMSRLSGDAISGKEALEAEFQAMFETGRNAKLEVETESIDFVSPSVALERGSATVIRPDAEPERTTYSVVHVKRDGRWKIDRITEDALIEPPSHYEQLKDLEWMVGSWVDQAGDELITTDVQWTRNQNFLTRSFKVTAGDQVDVAGLQIIAWDAAEKKIRSWVFDSNGGFAEGDWQKQGERWIVQTTATLADGGRASSCTILKPLDENSFSWQKINRVLDGQILPNIDEVIIVRQ